MANHFGSDWEDPCNTAQASQCVGYLGTIQEWQAASLGAGQLSATQHACTQIYDPVADIGCREIYPAYYVTVYDDSYGSAYYAWTACSSGAAYKGNSGDHTRACAPQSLKYDISHTSAYDTQSERRKIACHEMGHTFGLRHSTGDGTSTCMTATATQSTIVGISAHDESHLISYYPH
jgi:hypothetical protein